MTDTQIDATVPVTVSRPPTDTEERLEPIDFSVQEPSYTLVVPVAGDLFDEQRGINVRRFVQTAVAIAADNDGRVLLLGIAEVADDETLDRIETATHSVGDPSLDALTIPKVLEDRRSQLQRVLETAEAVDETVPIDARVITVPDATEGLLRALERDATTATLLMRGSSLDRSWVLGRSTVDTVLRSADCDVFVENVGSSRGQSALYVPDVEAHGVAPLGEAETESVDSILLCIGDGPHSALAAEASRAVATATGASVNVLHVLEPDGPTATRTEADDLVEFAEFVLGSAVESTTTIEAAGAPADVILDEATRHDFVVFGAADHQARLERLTFEPLHDVLSGRGDCTVLVARDADQTMRSLYYHWRQAMDSVEGEGDSIE